LDRRHILVASSNFCSANCGTVEDRDFINCIVFGKLWLAVSGWLGISTAFHENIPDHLFQFGGLGGFSKKSHLTFNILWSSLRYLEGNKWNDISTKE